jgi:hypothetical protein
MVDYRCCFIANLAVALRTDEFHMGHYPALDVVEPVIATIPECIMYNAIATSRRWALLAQANCVCLSIISGGAI